MTGSPMPYNKVGSSTPTSTEELAAREGMTEEQWRACNLPATVLELRWRYTNKTIHLYERRLRSLAAFNVGPAVRAWVRSRLEWVRDNRFYEMPEGIIVLTIDPEGNVDIQQEPIREVPAFARAEDAPGTIWLAKDGQVFTEPPIRHAADTLVRDLAKTLGYTMAEHPLPDDAECFAVSDEFGVVMAEGHEGATGVKLAECFDRLWNQGE